MRGVSALIGRKVHWNRWVGAATPAGGAAIWHGGMVLITSELEKLNGEGWAKESKEW
jgi:hypothetical protein